MSIFFLKLIQIYCQIENFCLDFFEILTELMIFL